MSRVRIAVTGVGLVTPLGVEREQAWKSLLHGDSAGRQFSFADAVANATQSGEDWYGAPVNLPSTAAQTRPSQFAVAASREALRQSGWTDSIPAETACVIGTSKTDLNAVDNLFSQLAAREKSVASLSPLYSSFPAAQVAAEFHLAGPVLCPVAACATGLVSIIRAAELVRHGETRLSIAGSTDSSLHRGLLASYRRLGVLAPAGNDPAQACRPFDRRRSGFIVGEGAAAMVLEDWDQAQQRGVTPIAEWVDGLVGCDPTGLTGVDESGATLANLIQRLLQRNHLNPQDISALCYHGTATQMNDFTEARAAKLVFGNVPPGFGIKGAIGHLMGAAGAVETAVSVLALRDQILPPSVNHEEHDPDCPNRLTGNVAKPMSIEYLLKTSLGFGGHLAVGLLKRVHPGSPE